MATVNGGTTPDTEVAERRSYLEAARGWLFDLHGYVPRDEQAPVMGIAFSGGGIRSATISLGIAQALARRGRLIDFDYMSTVSGGGYFGSFLRSLFIPTDARGSDGIPSCDDDLRAKQCTLALDAMTQTASKKTVPDPFDSTNAALFSPVQWLRENGRYLAPSGPTDYLGAATYAVRNWVAMLLVFALPVALCCLLMAWGDVCIRDTMVWLKAGALWLSGGFTVSLLPSALAVALTIAAVGCGVANFLTVYTVAGFASSQPVSSRAVLVLTVVVHVAVAVGTVWLAWCPHSPLAGDATQVVSTWFGPITTASGHTAWRIGLLACGLFDLLGVAIVLAVMAWMSFGEPPVGNALYSNELRRLINVINSWIFGILLAVLAIDALDTLAIHVVEHGLDPRLGGAGAGSLVVGWAFQRLQKMFSDGSSAAAWGALAARFMWWIALILALLLWGALAVMIDVLAHFAISDYPAVVSLTLVGFATLVVGASGGFINLSSLQSLYAARLTRAYLGASNVHRLSSGRLSRITGYEDKDVILAMTYQQQVCASPLHLINVTLNETIASDGSQLLERDRKGIPMVIGPDGLRIGAGNTPEAMPWTISDRNPKFAPPETFTVGQLAAISGAAASTAMGSRTTLGGALLFTFFNIRLGYWWRRGSAGGAWQLRPLSLLGTFGYLLREALARYCSNTGLVNLSDGGHFENSGAYELLRREARVLVVCDNGADPCFVFEDLENLVRKARIDLGLEIVVATSKAALAVLGEEVGRLFLNARDGDWRQRARDRAVDDAAFALLLEVYVDGDAEKPVARIVWIKPCLSASLPPDVWGYAEGNPSFPHESTAEQFFTEGQWESYRKLGFASMIALLGTEPAGQNLFRELY